ncbi:RNA polymerase sigma factor [SCandidatus Aminicenantes bacterium Aminicenantia_JdfR_composite]|jgi:RNA polymerase sigma-70 factor (ECF subfamily)|nr:RNA polymerase sigma factor [SCandidatus Aminicenantes bacterium Aminicenantia_JdfR_composite]MCP2596850.1 RNA polymerase sigma factor [Candidatus Aminicenantes bacterium AC-335-G13]MCP2605538.1 RNA polymerase sigma factor [Candidatus Aminicenantes bacterium AC-335-O07]
MKFQEKILIENAKKGDVQSFEKLILPYRKKMLNFAYRFLGNREDAKDVAQEVFLKAFKYIKSFNTKKNFINWLYQINSNLCINILRKREKELAKKREISQNQKDPHSQYFLSEFKEKLFQCLASLSPKERAVFILRDLEEKSIKETANILKCSKSSIKFNLFSARKKLKNELLKFYPQFGEKNE